MSLSTLLEQWGGSTSRPNHPTLNARAPLLIVQAREARKETDD